jgi:hypothetical protein
MQCYGPIFSGPNINLRYTSPVRATLCLEGPFNPDTCLTHIIFVCFFLRLIAPLQDVQIDSNGFEPREFQQSILLIKIAQDV